MMELLSKFSCHETSSSENYSSNENINTFLHDSNCLLEDKNRESYKIKDTSCYKDFQNSKRLICTFSKNLASKNQLPARIKSANTTKIDGLKEEDFEKTEKILNSVFSNDGHFPASDYGRECKCCSENFIEIQKFGISSFEIGLLINKTEFLEHCHKVEYGLLDHLTKNSEIAKMISNKKSEQYFNDLERISDVERNISSRVSDAKRESSVNKVERRFCVKFPSYESFSQDARPFLEDDQKTVDISHRKSVAQLIQYFESICDQNTPKQMQNFPRSIQTNGKTSYLLINRNYSKETKTQEQQNKRDTTEDDPLSTPFQKMNESSNCNMIAWKPESPFEPIGHLKNIVSHPVDNCSEVFTFLEDLWFLFMVVAFLWHLTVI